MDDTYETVTYSVEVTCGLTTCASSPGKFCPFQGVRRFGCQPYCMLYMEDLAEHTSGNRAGWVKRCDKCVAKSER